MIEISDRNDKTNLGPKFSLTKIYNNKKWCKEIMPIQIYNFFFHNYFFYIKFLAPKIYIYAYFFLPKKEKEKMWMNIILWEKKIMN